MNLRDYIDFEELVNESERLVIDELGRQVEEPENRYLLNDEDLLRDIAAYALNHVRPMYRANLLGRLYAKSLDAEESEEVKRAVTQAIEKIRTNP
ncbi:MAG: late competence development ComFB family protein [Spirochaetaceae bacterium]